MSLKFGIYLVEQRIISPEQFCGLVKIQEESSLTMASIALRKNVMTIKQVDAVLTEIENNGNHTFVKTALARGIIDQQDAIMLCAAHEATTPPLERLLVECGLLTQRQCQVLHAHFVRNGSIGMTQPAESVRVKKPHHKRSVDKPESTAATAKPVSTGKPPEPKFKQHRPMIVRQQSTS